MVYLQCSQKARTELGVGSQALGPPGHTDSALGNWMMTVTPIGNRHAFVFMSSSSLLSFPIMIGQKVIAFDDIPVLLSHGLTTLMKHMRTPRSQRTLLLRDLNEIAICKANDTSMIATFRSVTRDYDYYVGGYGGLANVDIGDIILKVNNVSRAKLGFRTSFEVSRELLQAGDVQQ